MKPIPATDDLSARQDAFRAAMRQLVSGVSIVASGNGDERAGITATSVSSFSVEPPTILVSIAQTSSIVPVLRRYRHFSANVLRDSQHGLADRFSGRGGIDRAQRFSAGNWITLITGAPILADALANLDCEVDEIIDRYTHSIVLARVVAVQINEGEALAHWRSSYLRIVGNAGG